MFWGPGIWEGSTAIEAVLPSAAETRDTRASSAASSVLAAAAEALGAC